MATRLRVWIMPSAGEKTSEFLNRHLKPFERKHPGISIEWRLTPWSRAWSNLIQAVKEGDLPDVVQVGSTWMSTLAHLDVFAPAPRDLADRSPIVPWMATAASHGEERVAVPWVLECNLCIARSDALAAAGLTPADLSEWDGFLDACRRIGRLARADAGSLGQILPFTVHCRPEYNTLHATVSWLWSGGWRMPEPLGHGARILSDERALPGFRLLSELYQSSPHLREMANAPASRIYADFFQEGRYALYLGPSDYFMRVTHHEATGERPSPWPLSVLPLPAGPAGSITRGGGSLLGVLRGSPNQEAAWELVRYLTDDPFITRWAAVGGEFPAFDSEYWRARGDDPNRALIYDALRASETYPPHRIWRTIEAVMMDGLSKIAWHYLQGRSHDEAAEGIMRRVDERISSLLRLDWEGVA